MQLMFSTQGNGTSTCGRKALGSKISSSKQIKMKEVELPNGDIELVEDTEE